jgi:hypothetical protein
MAATPRSTRRPLRASLITLVSTQNICRCSDVVLSFEVGIQPHIGHGTQQFR